MSKKNSSSKIYSQESSEVSDKLKKQININSNSSSSSSSRSRVSGGICCMRFLQCVIFIGIILLLLAPLILELGTDQVILYSGFKNDINQTEKENNRDLYNEIKQKRYITIMIDEQQQTNAVQQIESIIKRIKIDRSQSLTIRNYSDPYVQYRYAFKQTKKFIIQNIFIHFESFIQADKSANEQKVKNTWVLIGLGTEIPTEDVEQIIKQLPDDDIVIITNKQNPKYSQFVQSEARSKEQTIEVIQQKQKQKQITISQQQKLQDLIKQVKILAQKLSQKYEQISKKQQERSQAQIQRSKSQEQRQKSQQNRIQSLELQKKKRQDQQKQRLQLNHSLKQFMLELNNKLLTAQQFKYIKQSLDLILANQKASINKNENGAKGKQKKGKAN